MRFVNKKGFTLTEILIALFLVAVLIALLLPALKNVMPNNNKIMLKKAYSTLQNAVAGMINDDVNYPSDVAVTLNTYSYQRGFNNTTATTNASNKFCIFLSTALNTVGTVTCPGVGAVTNGTFSTSDGMDWTIITPISDTATNTLAADTTNYPTNVVDNTKVQFPVNSVYYTTKVIVDVNGSKGPNCTNDTTFATYSLTQCPANRVADKYIFGVRYDGKLQVGCSTVATSTLCTTATDQAAIDVLKKPTDNQ